MIFGAKSVIRPEKRFSSADLLDHAVLLLKSSLEVSKETPDNYSWLRAKRSHVTSRAVEDLDVLKPLIDKMTPESAAAIAVKLDTLVEESSNLTADAILEILQALLEEHCNLQLMGQSLKRMKSPKPKNVLVKSNKVKPILMPPGREATVCFVIEKGY